MKTAIGANVKIKWMDTADEMRWVYFSFSTEPDVDDWTGDEVDHHGVRDDTIFFYVDDEDGLKELIKYPCDNGYQLLDYKLIYTVKEIH